MSAATPSPCLDARVDALCIHAEKNEDLFWKSGILEQITRRFVECVLRSELSYHLGHGKHEAVTNAARNTRNGCSRKILKGEYGDLEIEVPRDRQGTFIPQLITKHQTCWHGFDDQIIFLYAQGTTLREMQGHLKALYQTKVASGLLRTVLSGVAEDIDAWQNRPLDSTYPIVYFDCIHIEVCDLERYSIKVIYLALGVNMEGGKDLLGLWMPREEGMRFWLSILTELHQRGVQTISIACEDNLQGFPEAIQRVFPSTQIRLCLVHMIRQSLQSVSKKQRPAVAVDLKEIYTAPTIQAARSALSSFEKKWGGQFPGIVRSWQANWKRLVSFFEIPETIRKVIYTTRPRVGVKDI